MKQGSLLFSLDEVTVRVRDKHILHNTSWTCRKGEHWAVIGSNGSGKTSLVRTITDEYTVIAGKVRKSERLDRSIGFVSFEHHQALFNDRQRAYRNYCYSGSMDGVPTAEEFISGTGSSGDPGFLNSIAETMHIKNILGKKITALSTGETRKILLCREIYKKPSLLILDEPFEGLDVSSREGLALMIRRIIREDHCSILLVTHYFNMIIPEITHLLWVDNLSVKAQGLRGKVLPLYERTISKRQPLPERKSTVYLSGQKTGETVIRMNGLSIVFDHTPVFTKLNWEVRKGEHWLITGPNGSGKSTLVKCITGELPQVYGQDVTLFGKKRGTGESIWDVRKHLSWISQDILLGYRKNVSCVDTVLSGLFDSIGLYRTCSEKQVRNAERWLKEFGLFRHRNMELAHLSFGEQTLVLLARAMIKNPDVLILDEPLQGLDPLNRRKLVAHIQGIALSSDTSVLCVTHHPGLFSDHLFNTLDMAAMYSDCNRAKLR